MSKTKINNARSKVAVQIALDLIILIASAIVSILMHSSPESVFQNYIFALLSWFVVVAIVYPTMYYVAGIHKIIWRFCSTYDMLKYGLIVVFSSLITFVIHFTATTALSAPGRVEKFPFAINPLPLGVYFTTLAIAIILIMFRAIYKRLSGYKVSANAHIKHGSHSKEEQNVMIIGGGYTGNLVINDLRHNGECSNYSVLCIIDDDKSKVGKQIQGVPIMGTTEDIKRIAQELDISLIIFAISYCSNERKAQILKICAETKCEVKTVPTFAQILSGEANVSQTRPIQIEDLLGREPIRTNLEKVMQYVDGKTVVVTGGGGSIGSELCRQLSSHCPKRLIIFDIYENSAYDISNEIKRNHPEIDLITLIGSVRDTARIESVLDQYRPDIIYHAAAHKHVPLMEDSPNEAIKNNVLGTYKLARAADKFGVKRFVMISTDKAVNPTNIMGATKRICEMIVQTFNNRSECEFVAVRFGNVLGSNGSVIPLFKRQIAEGGPVTVTHPDIIRYFMTIPEAVSLVIQAGASAKGGEIFVLDMGSPVKILDLAKNLITLMGHVPGEDIKIEFTGLRPGEKLYEELLMEEEGLTATEHQRIHIGHPLDINEDELFAKLGELEKVMYDDSADVRQIVKELVPTYNYSKK